MRPRILVYAQRPSDMHCMTFASLLGELQRGRSSNVTPSLARRKAQSTFGGFTVGLRPYRFYVSTCKLFCMTRRLLEFQGHP
jgi:hypothetical protein